MAQKLLPKVTVEQLFLSFSSHLATSSTLAPLLLNTSLCSLFIVLNMSVARKLSCCALSNGDLRTPRRHEMLSFTLRLKLYTKVTLPNGLPAAR
jgi:hypothetical protein